MRITTTIADTTYPDQLTLRGHQLVTCPLPAATLLTIATTTPHAQASMCSSRSVDQDLWDQLYATVGPLGRYRLISRHTLTTDQLRHVLTTETDPLPLRAVARLVGDREYQQLLSRRLDDEAVDAVKRAYATKAAGRAEESTTYPLGRDRFDGSYILPADIGEMPLEQLPDAFAGRQAMFREMLGTYLTSRLGADPGRWQTALALVDEHPGTLGELCDACEHLNT